MADVEKKVIGGTIVGLIGEEVTAETKEIKADTVEVEKTPTVKPETKKKNSSSKGK